jgi:hypothetical protein
MRCECVFYSQQHDGALHLGRQQLLQLQQLLLLQLQYRKITTRL